RADTVKSPLPVKVRLAYFDVKRKCMVEEVQSLTLVPAERDSCDLLADVEVKKNFTIAELAQSLYDMTESAKRRDFTRAGSLLNASIASAYRRYPNMEDTDIRFILNIVEEYDRDLKAFNGYNRKDDCGSCR
ncbi:MAG TPA: hypothetical protein VGP12_05685, partial [Nitrosospira sp.]|nr:hypothetical protein [Nitrosospira sp.]